MGTKLLGRSAVDYDAIVAPAGRHGFREEVASMWEGWNRCKRFVGTKLSHAEGSPSLLAWLIMGRSPGKRLKLGTKSKDKRSSIKG